MEFRDLSNNNLSGEIPVNGSFTAFTNLRFLKALYILSCCLFTVPSAKQEYGLQMMDILIVSVKSTATSIVAHSRLLPAGQG